MPGLRLFNENDIPVVVALCNKHMEFDEITEVLLREKVLEDPAYDPELIMVYEENNEMVGFIAGTTREIRGEKLGYVKLMVVAKPHRRKGIGTALYRALEEKLNRLGMEKVRVYDVPFNYFMPGIDPRYTPGLSFFEVQGFTRFAIPPI